MEFTTKSAEETKKLGEEIGTNLVNSEQWTVDSDKPNTEHRTQNTNIFALTGNLGSGKTTFVQGLAKGLGIRQRIISPTFIIMRSYKLKFQNSKTPKLQSFYHIDLYRLEENIGQEMKNLGMDEIFSDPANIIAIEWAEKAKDFIPKGVTWVEFENVGHEKRKVTFRE